jgi:hypothetical protein
MLNIEYTNSQVTWMYNGKKFVYSVNGIEFADSNNKSIYIEVYDGDKFEYIYISFEGEPIVSYLEEDNYITLTDKIEKKKLKINVPKLRDVALGANQNIYILAGDKADSRFL